jgi:hypothetical protein
MTDITLGAPRISEPDSDSFHQRTQNGNHEDEAFASFNVLRIQDL